MALGWRGSYVRYRSFFLNIFELYKKKADLRAFLEVMLSLTTVIVFISFALKPTVLTIISLTKEIAEKKKIVADLTLKVNNLEVASNLLNQNADVIPDINIAVSTKPSPDVISKQIQGVAARNSVSLLGLSVGQVTLAGKETAATKKNPDLKPMGSSGEMPISISIKGNFASIMAFAKNIEESRVAVKIDSLGINSSSTEVGQVMVAVVSGRVPFTSQTK